MPHVCSIKPQLERCSSRIDPASEISGAFGGSLFWIRNLIHSVETDGVADSLSLEHLQYSFSFVTTHSKFHTHTDTVEDAYQHGQPVYFPEELVDNWVSFSRRGVYYCYNISLRGCLNTTATPADIILAVKCDMGPEFLCNSFNSGGVDVTIRYMSIVHLNQEQVNMEFMSSSFLISGSCF